MTLRWYAEVEPQGPLDCRAVRELYEAALKSANVASAAMSYWPDEEQVYEVLERWERGGA